MYKPLPDSLTIKASGIEGLGLFAKKNIPEGKAVTALIDLIKEHGDWVEQIN